MVSVSAPVGSSNAAGDLGEREALVAVAMLDLVGDLVGRGRQRFVDAQAPGRENRLLVELLCADDVDRPENGPGLGLVLSVGGLGAELRRENTTGPRRGEGSCGGPFRSL